MVTLIQLTETDKRVIFAFFLLLILLFVIVGYIGLLITRVMKSQGQKIDTKVYDVVVTRVVTNKKEFKKYARKKSYKMFYKAAQIPMIILVMSGLCILLHFLINNFQYGLFDARHGFSTILFLWNFNDPDITAEIFGIKLLAKWPPLYEEIGKPQFVAEAIPSYLGVIGLVVGGLWYFYVIQAFIARSLRINKLSDSIFEKSLEGYNVNTQNMIVPNQQVNQNPNPQPQQNNTNINL